MNFNSRLPRMLLARVKPKSKIVAEIDRRYFIGNLGVTWQPGEVVG